MSQAIKFDCCHGEERFNNIVKCPECGIECCHPVRFLMTPPGPLKGEMEITNESFRIDDKAPPVMRGVHFQIDFVCEGNHGFTYALHFHKGATFIVGPVLREEIMDEVGCTTIWRD